jgi:hypothetical protein
MDKITITNEQLAAQFFDAMSRTSRNVYILHDMRKLIAECPESIADAFQQNGSLQNFKIPRLWREYYPVIEQILREGVEATSKTAIERNIAWMRENQWRNMPASGNTNPTHGILGDGSSRRDVQVRFKER